MKTTLNTIIIKQIKTQYNYDEDYICIDNTPLPMILNEFTAPSSDFENFMGLSPAFGNELVWEHEKYFVWKLIEQTSSTVVPILLCPDDLDFTCTVVVASIRKDGKFTYWDKIGYLRHQNYDEFQEQQSGILHLETYTKKDWDLYGDNIACCKIGDDEWYDWINQNRKEEYSRRFLNYVLPFYKDENNFEWFKNTNWIFTKSEYDSCIDYYKKKLSIIWK